nr:hypothetical protein [Type-D symbiont of Plautia stali]
MVDIAPKSSVPKSALALLLLPKAQPLVMAAITWKLSVVLLAKQGHELNNQTHAIRCRSMALAVLPG